MTEHEIATELIIWKDRHLKKYSFLETFFHIRNEGKPGKHSSEGILSGLPDYCLPVPRGRYNGFFLELKRHGKTPEKRQREVMDMLRSYGHSVWWADSLQKAIIALQRYCDLEEK